MTKTFRELNKLSELLDRGIRVMRGLDRDTYEPMAKTWHTPERDEDGNPVCMVCLAGAVMALHRPPNAEGSPTCYDEETKRRLMVLDDLRQGMVFTAMRMMAIPDEVPPSLNTVSLPNQNFQGWEQADAFLEEAETLRDTLIKEGL